MTTDDNHATPDPEQVWVAERARLRAQAIEALTAAVRLARPAVNGVGGDPEDFAGFLAEVLASVAANVGSTWLVTAGRPGSWEAALVDQLLHGTVGDDPADLIRYRTEPVRVPLHVDLLVDDYGAEHDPPIVPIEYALDHVWPAWTAHGRDDLTTDEEIDAAWQAIQDDEADVRARYRAAYTAYAQAFTAAVHEAARTIDG